MGRGPNKWTEELIARYESEGRGRGQGESYLPWLRVETVSSKGRSRRIFCPTVGRTIHMLSDVEYGVFLALEWQQDVVDIREQYPLDRSVTQDIARELRIRHPYYPGTHVPTVMTVDFLATRITNGATTFAAFDAKREEESADEASLLKLEITRTYFEERLDVPHHLVYHCDLPQPAIENIDWLRDALLKPEEVERHPGYFKSLCSRMGRELASPRRMDVTLASYCIDFDARYGNEPGTGLRVARMLMYDRVMQPDLTLPHLEGAPLSSYVMTAEPGKLRSIGGR